MCEQNVDHLCHRKKPNIVLEMQKELPKFQPLKVELRCHRHFQKFVTHAGHSRNFRAPHIDRDGTLFSEFGADAGQNILVASGFPKCSMPIVKSIMIQQDGDLDTISTIPGTNFRLTFKNDSYGRPYLVEDCGERAELWHWGHNMELDEV